MFEVGVTSIELIKPVLQVLNKRECFCDIFNDKSYVSIMKPGQMIHWNTIFQI